MSKSHVYISYASQNTAIAAAICTQLEASGIRCWIAPRDIAAGKSYGEEILRAVKSSEAVVVLLSESSDQSQHMAYELQVASVARVPIVPVALDDHVPSKSQLSYFLGRLAFINAKSAATSDLASTLAEALAKRGIRRSNQLPISQRSVDHPQKNSGYVFLSYSSQDRDFIEKLRDVFRRQNYAYWDYTESDRDYHNSLYRELEQRIEESVAFVCVVSDSWRDSKWPAAEFLYAQEARIPVFVLVAKPLSRPVPILLNQQTRIDMSMDFASAAVLLERALNRKRPPSDRSDGRPNEPPSH